MGNEFFVDHPIFGMFDLDRDGSLDAGEAGRIGSLMSIILDDVEESSREPDSNKASWEYVGGYAYGDYGIDVTSEESSDHLWIENEDDFKEDNW